MGCNGNMSVLIGCSFLEYNGVVGCFNVDLNNVKGYYCVCMLFIGES